MLEKLTINAGETSGTITIASIIDDPFDEPDETVTITLSNPVNATLGTDNTHTFTINDNDLPRSFHLAIQLPVVMNL